MYEDYMDNIDTMYIWAEDGMDLGVAYNSQGLDTVNTYVCIEDIKTIIKELQEDIDKLEEDNNILIKGLERILKEVR